MLPLGLTAALHLLSPGRSPLQALAVRLHDQRQHASLTPCLFDSCCACPETKQARDDCFLRFGHSVEEHGPDARKCEDLVRRHRECMASLGFKI